MFLKASRGMVGFDGRYIQSLLKYLFSERQVQKYLFLGIFRFYWEKIKFFEY